MVTKAHHDQSPRFKGVEMKKAPKKCHVGIVDTVRNGKPTYRLLSDDEQMNQFFDAWAYELSTRSKFSTVKSYCYAVKLFLNYVMELADQVGELTPIVLMNALQNYESFLVFGRDSESTIAASVAEAIGSHNLSGDSVTLHFAAINNFIDASETYRVTLIELERSGYLSNVRVSPVAIAASQYVAASGPINAAIKRKSWLAGCIAGGARKIKRTGLSLKSKPALIAFTDEFGGDDKAFPIDKCVQLIKSTSCLRDKVLWSLIAASGCRISEALTLQLDDLVIDVKNPSNNSVHFIDPASRRNELIHILTPSEIEKLKFKGRATSETYLIEPFASLFWTNLKLYMEEENKKQASRHRPVQHNFVIRNLKDGSPMVLSYVSLLERFQLSAALVTGESYGFHSLRHMYGYYLTNYCPHPSIANKFGLELGLVQKFLGHRSIETTKRYARKDAHALAATLAAINMLKMNSKLLNVTEVRIRFLENEISCLKRANGVK